MLPLNNRPRTMTIRELSGYIESFDNTTRFLVGIFAKPDDLHIGCYFVDVDWPDRNAVFNVLVGDQAYWGQKVVLETRPALVGHFFKERGIEKAIGLPLARNMPAVFNYKAEGWTLEGILRQHRRSATHAKRLDQLQFALLRQEWRAKSQAAQP